MSHVVGGSIITIIANYYFWAHPPAPILITTVTVEGGGLAVKRVSSNFTQHTFGYIPVHRDGDHKR